MAHICSSLFLRARLYWKRHCTEIANWVANYHVGTVLPFIGTRRTVHNAMSDKAKSESRAKYAGPARGLASFSQRNNTFIL